MERLREEDKLKNLYCETAGKRLRVGEKMETRGGWTGRKSPSEFQRRKLPVKISPDEVSQKSTSHRLSSFGPRLRPLLPSSRDAPLPVPFPGTLPQPFSSSSQPLSTLSRAISSDGLLISPAEHPPTTSSGSREACK